MAGGSAIRGSRVGAGPMGEAERGESIARFYSNGRNRYSCLVPCVRRPSKMASCSSPACFPFDHTAFAFGLYGF